MEITRLRYFCALAETQSVRRTSELLHVSPGALSKALGQVEELAGTPLFARVGRTIVLTDAGRAFHERAAQVIGEYERLKSSPNPAPLPDRPLRIGSFEVFTTHLLAHVISKEPDAPPVLALERGPGRLEEAVLSDEIDFGLTYAPIVSTGIELLPLGDFTMEIFGRPAWQRVRFEDLAFAVPITSVGGHVAGFQSLDGWPSTAPMRSVRYRFELLESALALAKLGRCVLHAPTFVVKLANRSTAASMRLSRIALPGRMKPVRATVYLVKRTGAPETTRLRAWARAIRQVLASDSPEDETDRE
jgi:DNA-binding transcriptional LysR family regulator